MPFDVVMVLERRNGPRRLRDHDDDDDDDDGDDEIDSWKSMTVLRVTRAALF